MRDYLKKVLELVKPYRFRFVVGLACGFLSGILAFTLPVSLKLAVDTIFSGATAPANKPTDAGNTNSIAGVSGATNNLSPSATPLADAATTNSIAYNEGSATNQLAADQPANQKKKLAVPGPLKRATAAVQAWFSPPKHPSTARKWLVICLIPGAMLLRGLLGYLNIYLLSWVSIHAANDLRVKVFSHLVNLPMSFFNDRGTGDLMTRVDGAMGITTTINGSFATIIREPITIVVLAVTLITMQPALSLATLIVFPICLLPVMIYGRKLRKSHSGYYAKFSNVSTVMHESFTAARVVKAYNMESKVVDEFRRAIDAVTGFFMRSVRASELPGPLIEFIGSIGVALIFIHFAFYTPGTEPVSGMLAFFAAVFGLYDPVKKISRLHSQLTLSRAGADAVFDILEYKTSLPEPANPKPVRAQKASIRFEEVSFAYKETTATVLHKINLLIKPGQLVALVGRTGSGKTSIASLLLRFYDPTAGGIFIGEDDIRSVASKDLRDNMGVVTQETILFNDTVRANIGLGRPGASDAEIEQAAKHAHAHEFIMEKPGGYDFTVGEKGANLSGGQRQRIAIARAVLKNAPILILDEATNSLDTEVERIVQEAMEKLMQDRTTICIAHRLSTIQKADNIVVLDEGRIVETGTHAQLMQAKGVYCKLYELQFRNGD
jgi:subfamily B ATP-binding cassette protein MsbA